VLSRSPGMFLGRFNLNVKTKDKAAPKLWRKRVARRYTALMSARESAKKAAALPAANPDAPARRSRRGSGSVTLADVAKLAGVSAITVSRALNTPDRVSPDTMKQVREAVEQTGYVPNLLAGSLASSKSRLVAALVPTIAGPVFLETIQTLTESLADAGYQLMLGQSGYSGSREDALLDAIIGRRPDGIVLTGVLHSEQGRRRLIASGIPVVETWDLTRNPIDMLVGFSHEEVGRAVFEYLHQRGIRHPAVLTADDYRASVRCQAFKKAADEALIRHVPIHSVSAPTTLKNGRAGLAALLKSEKRIDAIFCSSDLLALGVLIEAQSRGISIPKDLKVIGFGDLSFAADTHPALTTVRIDGTQIGKQAAKFIVDRAAGREVPSRLVDIGFSIVRRHTV
jgi:LacI family gluconate utilization system Gnt-I transcriptional repressor